MLRGFSRVFGTLVAILSLSMLSVSTASADFLIDDFNDSVGGDLSTVRSVLTSGAVIGPFTGEFNFVANVAAMPVFVTLRYDPLSNLDLTAGGDDTLQIDVAQLVKISPVTLKVTAVDGVTSTTITPVAVASGMSTIFIDYSDFGNPSVFTSLDRLEFRFESNDEFAVSLSELKAVPEPTTAMMLGGGLLGLAAAGRRRAA